jgi:hypothetical protein
MQEDTVAIHSGSSTIGGYLVLPGSLVADRLHDRFGVPVVNL